MTELMLQETNAILREILLSQKAIYEFLLSNYRGTIIPVMNLGTTELRPSNLTTYATVQQQMKDAETQMHEEVALDIAKTEKLGAWWKTKGGTIIFVPTQNLKGYVYDENGLQCDQVSINPYSLMTISKSGIACHQLAHRKAGFSEVGWPEWTK